jgi:hypothetical protein
MPLTEKAATALMTVAIAGVGPFAVKMMAARKEAEPAMNKDEDYICFYRDAVIAGHDAPAAETMRRFNLTRDYTVRLLNEAIARCDGQDIRNWNRRMRSPERRPRLKTLQDLVA